MERNFGVGLWVGCCWIWSRRRGDAAGEKVVLMYGRGVDEKRRKNRRKRLEISNKSGERLVNATASFCSSVGDARNDDISEIASPLSSFCIISTQIVRLYLGSKLLDRLTLVATAGLVHLFLYFILTIFYPILFLAALLQKKKKKKLHPSNIYRKEKKLYIC